MDQLRGQVALDGSSTVYPVTEAVAEEFQRATRGKVPVTVGISGTGGGFKKFCRGETDVSNASRPITKKEMDDCRSAGIAYLEMPVAYDALTVVIHPKNTWARNLTVAELRKMWEPAAQGKVVRWNQVNPAWPDAPLKLFGPGADSGTFEYFTEAVTGKAKSSRGDFTSSEDDNVLVQGVSSDELALGFIPFAYVEQNQSKLKLVPVDDGKGDNGTGAIAPSAETVRNGTYQPLSRPLFIYVARKAADRPEVQRFVEAFFTSSDLVREVGYVELTPQIYDLARTHFADRRVGTAFGEGGSQVGLTLEELLTREK